MPPSDDLRSISGAMFVCIRMVVLLELAVLGGYYLYCNCWEELGVDWGSSASGVGVEGHLFTASVQVPTNWSSAATCPLVKSRKWTWSATSLHLGANFSPQKKWQESHDACLLNINYHLFRTLQATSQHFGRTLWMSFPSFLRLSTLHILTEVISTTHMWILSDTITL